MKRPREDSLPCPSRKERSYGTDPSTVADAPEEAPMLTSLLPDSPLIEHRDAADAARGDDSEDETARLGANDSDADTEAASIGDAALDEALDASLADAHAPPSKADVPLWKPKPKRWWAKWAHAMVGEGASGNPIYILFSMFH